MKNWVLGLILAGLNVGAQETLQSVESYERNSILSSLNRAERHALARLESEDTDGQSERQLRESLRWIRDYRSRLQQGSQPPPSWRFDKIAKGTETVDHPATGALLFTGQTGCSGTLVGSRSFLTAKHCFDGHETPLQPSRYRVYLQYAGILSVAAIELAADMDLAVLTLDEDVTWVLTATLNDVAQLESNTSGQIVGFGVTTGAGQGSGIKRQGSVLTTPCTKAPDVYICWNFAPPYEPKGDNSNTCAGDSGGPLFTRPSTAKILAGVALRVSDASLCAEEAMGWDLDVFGVRSWIQGQIPEGEVGSAVHNIQVRVEDYTLDWLTPKAYFTFDVPDEHEVVNVAMNGIETGGTDFDLAVRQGTGRPHTKDDCAQVGQYASCQFQKPLGGWPSGSWSARVERVSTEGGLFQLVVSSWSEVEDARLEN